MILLLGGTSETAAIAAALAAAGIRVLVSTATGLASSVLESDLVAVRTGLLHEAGLQALIVERRARAVVDATHPYAVEISKNAQAAALRAGLPYLRYLRPLTPAGEHPIVPVVDHEEAARRAVLSGRPVLLTIGTRHLAPYVREARRASVPVIARVLPTPESRQACERAGLSPGSVIPGRGPFCVEDTVALVRRFRVGVLVTKDGGREGGVPQKLEAARREGCEVIVVARPVERTPADRVYVEVRALADACLSIEEGRAAYLGPE